MIKRTTILAVVAGLALAFLPAAAQAASTWNVAGTSNNWSDTANWTGGVPNATGAVVTFGTTNDTTPNNTVNVDGAFTLHTLSVGAVANRSIGGTGSGTGSIIMDGTAGAAVSIVAPGSSQAYWAVQLSGSGDLNITTPGSSAVLFWSNMTSDFTGAINIGLSSANLPRFALSTWSGSGSLGNAANIVHLYKGSLDSNNGTSATLSNPVRIEASSVGINGSSAGTTSLILTGTVTLGGNYSVVNGGNANATVTFGDLTADGTNAYTYTKTGSNALAIGGVISNLAGFVLGASTTTNTSAGAVTFSGSNSNISTGMTTVNGGTGGGTGTDNATMYLSKTGGAVAIAGNLTIGDSLGIDLVQLTQANQFASTSAVTINAASGTAYGKLDLNSKNATIASLASGGTSAANALVTSSGAATLTISPASGSTSYGGVISGASLALIKSGNGTQELTGINTYGGATTVSGGILSVATLADGGSPSGIGASSNTAASLALNGGTLQYTGAGANTNRVMTILAGGGTLDASGSGPVNFTSPFSPAFGVNNEARSLTLAGTNTGNNTFTAALANNGNGGPVSVTKTGVGTWVLPAGTTEGYTGATTISLGLLRVDGTLNAGSAVAVNATDGSNFGTLGGIGTVGGVTVAQFAHLAPGDSPGTLHTGNLNFQTGAVYDWEYGTGSPTDLVAVTGTLTFGATATLNIDPTAPAGTYNLFTYTGVESGTPTWTFNGTALTPSVNIGGGFVTLTLAPVPEPATLAFLAISGMVLAAGAVRRRIRKA